MWRAADALRQRVDADPGAIGPIREVLDPVEEELWSEADEIVETPDRWARRGELVGRPRPGSAAVLRP